MNFTWLMRPGTASAFTPKPLTPFKYMLRLGEGGGGGWVGIGQMFPPPSKILCTPLIALNTVRYVSQYFQKTPIPVLICYGCTVGRYLVVSIG